MIESAVRQAHAGVVAIGDLTLESGESLPDVRLAWQATGAIEAARPVVLLLHGYTNRHTFWRHPVPVDMAGGWGNALVGPGAAIDSDRYLVISLNHLGSCYGSTGPGTARPGGAGAYDLSFPKITIGDQCAATVLALHRLGIDRVACIVGYSYGGYMAFQMTLDDMIPHERVAILASAPRGNGSEEGRRALEALARAPSVQHLYRQRLQTLSSYGLSATDPAVDSAAKEWAAGHHPVSLLRLREAAMAFDRQDDLSTLSRPLFWLHVRDDALFPSPEDKDLPPVPRDLLTRHVCPSGGHHAPVRNPEAFADPLRRFMAGEG